MPGDPDKPNFIFSSDIPSRVAELLHDKAYLVGGGETVDLAENTEFTLNIELNTLLLRNPQLRPSDLIKENLIYLAKQKSHRRQKSGMSPQPPKSPVKCLSSLYKLSKETFVVSLTLKLLDLIVNVKIQQVRIDLLKDENYGLLLVCDPHLVDQVEGYIRKRVLKEIASPDPDTTLEDNFMVGLPSAQDISIDETILESALPDKSCIYDEDFDSSMEDLDILRSNDTTQSDDESFKASSPMMITTRFVGELNNLRHNETDSDIASLNKREATLDLEASMMTLSDDSDLDDAFKDIPQLTPTLSPPVEIHPESPRKTLSRQPLGTPTLRMRSSMAFINTDDNQGLPYAFRAEDVPSYIKQDKKFKFIKVGKVQKFVSLFEEKMEGESPSRQPTRASSPVRK